MLARLAECKTVRVQNGLNVRRPAQARGVEQFNLGCDRRKSGLVMATTVAAAVGAATPTST